MVFLDFPSERRRPAQPSVARRRLRPGSCALAVVLCLVAACGRSQGKALGGVPAPVQVVRSSGGSPLGRLKQVDPMPCYEFVYEADYRLEDLVRPTSSAWLSKGTAAYACTGFSARLPDGRTLLGRNFDWYPNPALVLITRPKGRYASLSLVDISYLGYSTARTPMEAPQDLEGAWRLPFDGMNEKGLVVGMMAVDHAEGPKGAGKPRIGELGILRVLLDRAATVQEAIVLMGEYEIDLADPPLHYLLADRSGDAAVVEFTGGKRQVFRTGKSWAVSTNFLLGEVPPPARDDECWRFAKVSASLAARKGVLNPQEALDLLAAVSVPRTRWSAVYEPGSQSLTLALVRRFRQPHRWSLE